MIRPSKVLRIYYLTTFVIGLGLTVPVAHCVRTDDVGARGAALLILSWNILFVMILPLILDWAESRYFKARFWPWKKWLKTIQNWRPCSRHNVKSFLSQSQAGGY